jgi:copper chaperone CopZ
MRQKETISVQGMHCQSCVKNIERTLSKRKDVEDVTVDLTNETVSLVYYDTAVSLDELKDDVRTLGYAVDGTKKKPNNLRQGLMYGLLPHTGCILFLIGSVLGATVLMNVAKPLLMNRYFFHILIGISIGFATLSSVIYLRKNGFLSLQGARKKWRYLLTMYGSTIGINVLLFFVIFPMTANASVASGTQELIQQSELDGTLESLSMTVDIPCPGHAPLISNELKTIDGVLSVEYSFPESFAVEYDSTKTGRTEIFGLDVFATYPAEQDDSDISTSTTSDTQPTRDTTPRAGACGSPSCGSSTCTGTGSCSSCGA